MRRTPLRRFGTIRQKYYIVICCMALCSMTINLAGKRHPSPSSCCLQGICFPCPVSLQKAFWDSCVRHRVLQEVYPNLSLRPAEGGSDPLDTGLVSFCPKANDTKGMFPLGEQWALPMAPSTNIRSSKETCSLSKISASVWMPFLWTYSLNCICQWMNIWIII